MPETKEPLPGSVMEKKEYEAYLREKELEGEEEKVVGNQKQIPSKGV